MITEQQVGRGFSILLIDDDNPGGCREAVLMSLKKAMGGHNELLEFEQVLTYEAAQDALAEGVSYDLILFDIRLGNSEIEAWGGVRLLVDHWLALKSVGSEMLLYSGKLDAIAAFGHFDSPSGPFRFYAKSTEFEPGQAMVDILADMLRHRSMRLCHQASPSSVRAMLDNPKMPHVVIGDELWSVDALVAPFQHVLPGESVPQREAVVRALFPCDDLVRIFTYWFKGGCCQWPADATTTGIFGLSPLRKYHLGTVSGPMDALMHEDAVASPQYASAASDAAKDFRTLRMLAPDDASAEYLDDYIARAGAWKNVPDLCDDGSEDARDSLQQGVKFELTDLINSLDCGQPTGGWGDLDGIKTNWLYCFPFRYRDDQPWKPCVKVAFTHLKEALAGRTGESCELLVKADRGIDGNQPLHASIVIRHKGPRCADGNIAGWFAKGHDLGKAARLLKGYATWTVISGGATGGRGSYAEVVSGVTHTEDEANSLWTEFNPGGDWNIVHVIRIGLPVF